MFSRTISSVNRSVNPSSQQNLNLSENRDPSTGEFVHRRVRSNSLRNPSESLENVQRGNSLRDDVMRVRNSTFSSDSSDVNAPLISGKDHTKNIL